MFRSRRLAGLGVTFLAAGVLVPPALNAQQADLAELGLI